MPGVLSGDNAVTQYLNRMTDTDSTLRGHITTLIEGLMSANLWDKLDYLHVIQNLEADSIRNLVNNTTSLTLVSCTYTANVGILTTSATDSVIKTNFNPSSAASKMADSNAFVMSYINSLVTVNAYLHARYFTVILDDDFISQLIDTGRTGGTIQLRSPAVQLSITVGVGLYAVSRVNSYETIVKFGTLTKTGTQSASGSLKNGTQGVVHGSISEGGAGTNINQFCAMSAGSGMTVIQLASLKTLIENYLTSRGAI